MIPNQIGLTGDKTPPQYMAEIEARVHALMQPKLILDLKVLKIERRFNSRFSHPEYHFTLRNPFARRRTFFDPANDVLPTGRPAKLIVFGAIPHQKNAWHARAGTVYYDVVSDWPQTMTLGYKNPHNLANY